MALIQSVSRYTMRIAITLVASLYLASCFPWRPGEDPEGVRLQAQMTQVIDAVKAYRARYGRLPENLDRLVPEFIVSLPSRDAFLHTSSDGVVLLMFKYSASWPQSGEVNCATDIEHLKWECTGYL